MDEANKGVEKIKEDEQRAKNEKLYPKKVEEKKEGDCVDDSRVNHRNKPTSDVADDVKELREGSKGKDKCVPPLQKILIIIPIMERKIKRRVKEIKPKKEILKRAVKRKKLQVIRRKLKTLSKI